MGSQQDDKWGKVAGLGYDGFHLRVNFAFQLKPLLGAAVPHSNDEVLFVGTLGNHFGFISEGDGYRRVKGSPIRTELVNFSNKTGVFWLC